VGTSILDPRAREERRGSQQRSTLRRGRPPTRPPVVGMMVGTRRTRKRPVEASAPNRPSLLSFLGAGEGI
jgi:hypothetical protein